MPKHRIKYERLILPALALSAACHLLAALVPAGAVEFLFRRESQYSRSVRFEVVQLPEEPLKVLNIREDKRHRRLAMQVVGLPPLPRPRLSLNWQIAVIAPELGSTEPPSDNLSVAERPPEPSAAAPDSIAGIDAYLSGVLSHIERSRRYPETARRMGQQGAVEVTFAIGRDGSLRHPARLVGPSPFGSLNRAACSSIQRSTPFPPLPSCIAADTLDLIVRIVFRLN